METWIRAPRWETLLDNTNAPPAQVVNRVRELLGPRSGATARSINEARATIDSGLTAVSLRGLTRLELIFAVGLAAAGSGLVVALGLEERRRTLAIASALGANKRQLGSFVWSEVACILAGGLLVGTVLGWGVAHMLVKLLTQVFDPAPQHVSIPWTYCLLVLLVTAAGLAIAAGLLVRLSRRNVLFTIRQL